MCDIRGRLSIYVCASFPFAGLVQELIILIPDHRIFLHVEFTCIFFFFLIGYEYIARKLMGETETDLTVQKKLLHIFTPHIVDNLDPKQLTDSLFAKDLISVADKEEIENKQKFENTTAATLVLLDRIPRRKDNWLSEFVVTLRECGYKFVADELSVHECIPSHLYNGKPLTINLKEFLPEQRLYSNRRTLTILRSFYCDMIIQTWLRVTCQLYSLTFYIR